MTVSVCPAVIAHASIDQVWSLLSTPSTYSNFWDVCIEQISPEGKAQVGQLIRGKSKGLGKKWKVIFVVETVDEQKHQIGFKTMLPLGIIAHNLISCIAANTDKGEAACLIRYG